MARSLAHFLALLGALGCTPAPPPVGSAPPAPARPQPEQRPKAEPELEAKSPAPDAGPLWSPVSPRGIAQVFADESPPLVTLGNQFARVRDGAIEWDPCLSAFPEYVPDVLDLRSVGSGHLLAMVSNGAQSSLWMSYSPTTSNWTQIEGSFAEKRSAVLAAPAGAAALVLLRRRFELNGKVSFRALRVGDKTQPLPLRPHPRGCVKKGLYLWDLAIGSDGSIALLCSEGVERWASPSAAPELIAHPAGVSKEELPSGPKCPNHAIARPLRKLTLEGDELSAVLLAQGGDTSLVLRGKRGAKSLTQEQTLDGVATSWAGRWLATVAGTESGCATQLWRERDAAYAKVGTPLRGAAHLLVSADGQPILVGSEVIRWASGESPTPDGPVDAAALVDGELWLSTQRGWLSRRRYQERGEPWKPCQR